MKKSKIYVPNSSKIIHNNQKECSVIEGNYVLKKELTIDEKINQLLNSNGYLFSKEVKIITSNKEYVTSIIRLTSDSLVTIDNDIIKIKDIQNLIIM